MQTTSTDIPEDVYRLLDCVFITRRVLYRITRAEVTHASFLNV